MGSLAIVLNPRSGSAPGTAELDRALRAVQLRVEICHAPARRVDEWLAGVARRHDVLVAAGGDGTVSTVAAAAVAAGRTLGVIPAGTLNHFARDAGIPADLHDAVGVLAEGHTELFDVGAVNGLTFINNASLGAYPRIVWERARAQRKGLPRAAAMTVAVLRTWMRLPNLAARFSLDGVELMRRSPFFVVANGEYLVYGRDAGRRPSVSDGKLSLYVAPRAGRLAILALPTRALLHRLEDYDRFERFHARRITMALPRRRAHVALDGEIRLLTAPLHFEVRRRVLRVLVPPLQPGSDDPGLPSMTARRGRHLEGPAQTGGLT